MEVYLHAFLTSALHGGEWSASRPGHFTPRETARGTHWIGGCVDLRAVLDTVVKRKILSPCRLNRTLELRSSRPIYHLFPVSEKVWRCILVFSTCRMHRVWGRCVRVTCISVSDGWNWTRTSYNICFDSDTAQTGSMKPRGKVET
jgi:hypothetical protein